MRKTWLSPTGFEIEYEQHDDGTYEIFRILVKPHGIVHLSPSAWAHLACLKPPAYRQFLDELNADPFTLPDVVKWLEDRIDHLATCSFDEVDDGLV